MQKYKKELNVVTKAKDLIEYTLSVTDNTKRFPKKARFTIVNRIQGKALSIYENLLRANEYDLRLEEERQLRKRVQKDALILCKELLFFIELSKNKNYINTKSCEYWTRLVLDVKYMTAAWIKKDKQR